MEAVVRLDVNCTFIAVCYRIFITKKTYLDFLLCIFSFSAQSVKIIIIKREEFLHSVHFEGTSHRYLVP